MRLKEDKVMDWFYCMVRHFHIVTLACISIIFFFFNRAVPFYADDYNWINILPQASVWDELAVWVQSLDFNPTLCGRLMCHLAVQTLLPFGELWFDCVNTIMLFISMYLTLDLCFQTHKNSPIACCLIVFAYLYFPPNAETLFYWGSGSANYLFPVLLVLLYFKGMNRCLDLSRSLFVFYCIVAFIAGWSHEIFSLPIAFALLGSVIIQKKKLCFHEKVLWGSFLLGSFCLFFSPGSISKLLFYHSSSTADVADMLKQHFLQAFKMLRDGKWLLVFILLFIFFDRRFKLRSFLRYNSFYFLCLCASICMIAFLGHGGRAIWGIEVFSFVLIFKFLDRYIDKINASFNKIAYVACVCLIVHLSLLIVPYYDSWKTYRDAERYYRLMGSSATIPIDDWHSDIPFIDCFVAHPYQMMMHDRWIRFPGNHSICNSNIYQQLTDYPLEESQFVQFGKVWVTRNTLDIQNKLETGVLKYELLPISYDSEGSFLSNSWHMILQRFMPKRYPSVLTISQSDVISLKIQDKEYLLFNQPFNPIWRDIQGISD